MHFINSSFHYMVQSMVSTFLKQKMTTGWILPLDQPGFKSGNNLTFLTHVFCKNNISKDKCHLITYFAAGEQRFNIT